MSRQATLLAALAAIAIVALSFFFLIKPQMDEVAELDAEAEEVRSQQAQVESEIASLESVRAESPNVEAELAAVGAIIPDSPSLPATLRQLQVAGDESGITLNTVAPARPASAVADGLPELARIPLSLTLEGGYFQIVDFLRRIEDPTITSRGILVTGLSVTRAEYPTLSVNVTAEMFALLDQPFAEAPEPEPTETDTEADEDADVEVDVDVTEEDGA